MTGTAYRCPKCRKRLKLVSMGPGGGRWRCPRCGVTCDIYDPKP